MVNPYYAKTLSLRLQNVTAEAIERNLEAQQRVISGQPIRACDMAPLLDTFTILQALKREINDHG